MFHLSGKILYLVLTAGHNRVGYLALLPNLPKCNHSVFIFCYNFEFTYESMYAVGEKSYWFKGKYQKTEYHLQSYDWSYEPQLIC